MAPSRLVAPFLALALLFAACGDDDDTSSADVSADVDAEVDADVDGDGFDSKSDAGDSIIGAVDEDGTLSDALDSLSIDTRLGAGLSGLGAEGEIEVQSENEATVTFEDRSVDEALTDCIILGSIIEEDETVTLVYDDGEETC